MDILSSININVFKEPRGFIRVLQFVFSICAFATTTNFGSYFSFKFVCANDTTTSEPVKVDIEYPFRIDHETETGSACGKMYKINFWGDFASDSQYFVAAGVLAMLYSAASLAFYALRDATYQANKNVPLADFAATMIAAVLWLSGSAAWASGLNALKAACNPEILFSAITMCSDSAVASCETISAGNFSGLNISIVFGFLNFFLWAANLWFLYKETTWFQENLPGGGTAEVQSPQV